MNRRYLSLLIALLPAPAYAHLIGTVDRTQPVQWWSVDPFAVGLLLLAAAVYARGSARLAKRALSDRAGFLRRRRFFWLGWGALFVALGTPLDAFGEVLFSAHMVQHELMMLIAAPYLVLSRPSSALLQGLPRPLAGPAVAPLRHQTSLRAARWLLTPLSAWTVHFAGLWAWHVPALFNAGLRTTWVHSLQHLSFLLVALIFWFALLRPRRSASAAGVVYLFTTALHASLLGALLTFSPEVWYTPYRQTAPQWGLTALEDQQLGGLIMWMPAGIVFVAAALVLLARLLRDQEPPLPGDAVTERYKR